ncbi:MAG: hypothetical protein A2Y15_03050 [Clostridiales bacterium GWF2_36_10]|nr:MAG: hypothetical protein A2Y15_03050 [Clostridiales bacterium GWF2_36_10]HAN20951.1 hypothetical protein [Clostridiales bacterium]
MYFKRVISVVIMIALLITIFTSCFNGGKNNIELNIDGKNYKVSVYNYEFKSQDVLMYDRYYHVSENEHGIKVKGKSGYKLLTVYIDKDSKTSEILVCDSTETDYLIPTNGYLVFFKDGPSSVGSISIENYNQPAYIDLSHAAVLTADGKNGVPINYKDCEGFPEEGINLLMSPATTFTVSDIPGYYYALNVKRNTNGTFTVMETDVKKYGNKYFTLVFVIIIVKHLQKKCLRRGVKL